MGSFYIPYALRVKYLIVMLMCPHFHPFYPLPPKDGERGVEVTHVNHRHHQPAHLQSALLLKHIVNSSNSPCVERRNEKSYQQKYNGVKDEKCVVLGEQTPTRTLIRCWLSQEKWAIRVWDKGHT